MAKASQIGFVDVHGIVHRIDDLDVSATYQPTGATATTVAYATGGSVETKVPKTQLDAAVAAHSAALPASARTEVVTIDDTDVDYAPLGTDRVILVDTSSDVCSIQLPDPATFVGMINIRDLGSAATNNITIKRYDSEEINGSGADLVISTNNAAREIVSDGTNWWTWH